jgi:hypothetical protein
MVHAMAFDRGWLPRVAWIAFAIAACHPDVPPAPPGKPRAIDDGIKKRPTAITAGPGRHVVVGEMCPLGAAGRPAVAGLAMRGVQWTDNASEVGAAIERGSVPRFVVFGVDGKMAGTFDTLGVVDVGIPQPVASGTYAGASPCTYGVGGTSDKPATRAEDPTCGQFVQSCGLAVGELSRPDEAPTTVAYQAGGACIAGDQLAVDIDGDGQIESFPLAGALDGIRSPASEWTASAVAGAACKPKFQFYDVRLVAEPDPGKPVDPKSNVMVDVLGVVDLDNDGRKELVLAYRFATVRTIVVFSAMETARRLTMVGEAPSFPR